MMRPGFFFGGFFWGLILVFFGISIIINSTLHINIPYFQIFIALIFIYFGVMILFGGSMRHRGSLTWNGAGYREYVYQAGSGNQNYGFSFGGGLIDLSAVDVKSGNVVIGITSSFGGGSVLISPDIPVRIRGSASFGGITFPDHSTAAFGSSTYQSKNFNENEFFLDLTIDTSFGGMQVVTSRDDINDWHGTHRDWHEAKREWKRRYRR